MLSSVSNHFTFVTDGTTYARQMVLFRFTVWLLLVQLGVSFTCFPVVKLRAVTTLQADLVNDGTDSTILPHVRRQRYAGSYPRFFKDRHKERNGDVQTVAKVVAKGGTPAGQHRPVMLQECLTHLGLSGPQSLTDNPEGGKSTSAPNNPPICIDCTLGYGGHSTAILSAIAPLHGTLLAIDQDSIELAKTAARMQPLVEELQHHYSYKHSILHTKHANFGHLLRYTNEMNITGKVTAVLCDLGYSSMQVDDPSRGFTYKAEGPLDMRMDTTGSTIGGVARSTLQNHNTKTEQGVPLTAYQYLLNVPSASALASVLSKNSDLAPALHIAMALLGPSKEVRDPPKTTTEFAHRIRTALIAYSKKQARQGKTSVQDNEQSSEKGGEILNYADKTVVDSCIAKALQAIRIEVNSEFQMLEMMLHVLPRILAPGGKVVFLTFHSGEDRRVKKALKSGTKNGIYSSWSRDVVLPSPEERFSNPRSKCAKLRWAVRSDLMC